MKVRLGEYDVSSIQEPILHEERHVAQIIVNPEFDNKTLTNDIALLKLKLPADKKTNIDIVCIPDNNSTFGSSNTCYITGWGRRSEGKLNHKIFQYISVNTKIKNFTSFQKILYGTLWPSIDV